MGKMINGILGTMTGKVGGMVGSTWKGINTARAYVIPANPQTVAQMDNRDRFSAIQGWASNILATIISTYWNPIAVGMTGYNKFISVNKQALSADPFDVTVSNYVSVGSLESVKTVTGVLAAGSVTFAWSKTCIGNGLTTDAITVVVVHKTTKQTYISSAALTRNDEAAVLAVTGETVAADLLGFVIAKRGTGSTFTMADSVSCQVSA